MIYLIEYSWKVVIGPEGKFPPEKLLEMQNF